MRKATLILLILAMLLTGFPAAYAEEDSAVTYEYEEISFRLPASMEKNEEEPENEDESYISFVLKGNISVNFMIKPSMEELKAQYDGDELDVIVGLVGLEDFTRDSLKDAAVEERDGLKLYCFEFDIPFLTNHITAIYALAPRHTYVFNLVYGMMGHSLKDINEISAIYDMLYDSLKYVGEPEQSGGSKYDAGLIAKHIITEDGYFVMRPRQVLRKFNEAYSADGALMTFKEEGDRCNFYFGEEQRNIFLQFIDTAHTIYQWGSGLDSDQWNEIAVNIATDDYTADEEFLATFSLWMPLFANVLGLDFDSEDFKDSLIKIGDGTFPAYSYFKDGLMYTLRAYDASFIYGEQTIVYEAYIAIINRSK